MNNLPKRKPNRLENYDYALGGAYFVTICAKDKKCLFGRIVGATVLGRPPSIELASLGKEIQGAILHSSHDEVQINSFVVMPNHVHMIVEIKPRSGERGRSPLQNIVRSIKAYATKQAGETVWQKSFYDHVIRDEADYLRILEYIENNPAKWELDELYQEEM